MPLDQDYTLKEVALAMRRSERWLRYQIQAGAEHMRATDNGKITFTAEQVAKLRSAATTNADPA